MIWVLFKTIKFAVSVYYLIRENRHQQKSISRIVARHWKRLPRKVVKFQNGWMKIQLTRPSVGIIPASSRQLDWVMFRVPFQLTLLQFYKENRQALFLIFVLLLSFCTLEKLHFPTHSKLKHKHTSPGRNARVNYLVTRLKRLDFTVFIHMYTHLSVYVYKYTHAHVFVGGCLPKKRN